LRTFGGKPVKQVIIFCVFSIIIVTLVLGCIRQNSNTPKTATPYEGLRSEMLNPNGVAKIGKILVATPRIALGAECLSLDELRDTIGDAVTAEVAVDSITGVNAATALKSAASDPSILDAGRKVAADSVLMVELNRCEERKGSSLGAEQGAVVSLTFTLLSTQDRTLRWRASYFVNDQATFDNLLTASKAHAKHGWRSARDLITAGSRDAMKDLESKRQASFLEAKA
jgi:hypothetical protein